MRISDWSSDVCSSDRPIHLATGFHEPESAKVIECGVDAPRDFTPERTAQTNVYEAVSAHISDLRKAGKRVILASYTKGSRERMQGLLADHGLKRTVLAHRWQEAVRTGEPPVGNKE